ncbi:hypothetical protein K1X13_05480 [Nocardioides sp. WL0053]|uniref:Uncharacterized protein n=1 Tax=Nocardioides jiangsuensis TaxID=2866161 RepID=A0ABS7RGW5_9ACTN|nr:hypothetical protein [Nocardioides jiangsuensis]MBY9074269.1 hypothetical protein [Nocardioides jiangsuensis]
MSESSNETGTSTPSGDERRPPAPPETGLIEDEQLPEDLRPAENPLARQPGDEDEDEAGTTDGGSPKVDGMPDMGQPGA